MPSNSDITAKMRRALDDGYHPFSFEWYSNTDGKIGANEFEVLELGEFYE